jgi:hypothetical protein
MATLTQTYRQPYPLRLTIAKKVDSIIEALLPRRCMVASAILFLIGIGIPFLMVIGLLPANLLLGLLGFALTATGGVLALTLCGEI